MNYENVFAPLQVRLTPKQQRDELANRESSEFSIVSSNDIFLLN
jgi:hypothetical protein